jgi:hypothetical protein
VRAQECGQPSEPRRRPGIGRPGTGRRGHGKSLAGTGFEQTGVPRGSPGEPEGTNANPTLCPRAGPRWSLRWPSVPLLSARGCWRWCGHREDEPGRAISDRGLLQGLIGRRYRHWQA